MKNHSKGTLHIGTSGIVVPGTKQTFPAAFRDKSRLNYYASLFNTVEINSSFYKVPLPATFEKWSKDVPDDFSFTVKLWRDVSHAKGLEFNLDDIDFFMKAANQLGEKKACLLIQFPASVTIGRISEVTEILERLSTLDRKHEWHIALEFRHVSWYTGQTYALLDKYHAGIVLHDMPASKTAVLNEGAKFVYLRFHGPKGDYKGSYPAAFLQEWQGKIQGWLTRGKDVYVYFNNTMGDALQNALDLQSSLNR